MEHVQENVKAAGVELSEVTLVEVDKVLDNNPK